MLKISSYILCGIFKGLKGYLKIAINKQFEENIVHSCISIHIPQKLQVLQDWLANS